MGLLSSELARRVYLDFAKDDAVLVSGSGRSGTSWLANLCNYRNEFRYIFEPLNPDAAENREANIEWYAKINESHTLFSNALNGSVSGLWADSRNRKFIARRRLIKEIRSNLLLPWVAENHPACKNVLILRNPLAVAASRKQLSTNQFSGHWVWRPSLEQLLANSDVQKLMSEQQFELLKRYENSGVVMETIADWCVNNLLIAERIQTSVASTVFYEDLVLKPKTVLSNLFEVLGIEIDNSLWSAVSQRSETTRGRLDENSKENVNRLNQWQDVLSRQEQKQAVDLLAQFNVQRFYSVDWVPTAVGQTG